MPRPSILSVVAILAVSACIDPAEPRPVPLGLDRSLVLMALLDPDAGPVLLVTTTEARDTTLTGLRTFLAFPGGEVVTGRDHPSCPATVDAIAILRCLTFDAALDAGQEYSLRATADGYPAAEGSAAIPGDFQITSYSSSGAPPGSAELWAEWTPSAGAHRYMVAIRSANNPRCHAVTGCGWWVATEDSRFEGVVPGVAYREGDGPWYLDIYAVERNLWQHLSSGTPGGLFSVPPASNVVGGFGVIGAWVRRSVPLGP